MKANKLAKDERGDSHVDEIVMLVLVLAVLLALLFMGQSFAGWLTNPFGSGNGEGMQNPFAGINDWWNGLLGGETTDKWNDNFLDQLYSTESMTIKTNDTYYRLNQYVTQGSKKSYELIPITRRDLFFNEKVYETPETATFIKAVRSLEGDYQGDTYYFTLSIRKAGSRTTITLDKK